MPFFCTCCETADEHRKLSDDIDKQISQWMKSYNKSIKLLLLGEFLYKKFCNLKLTLKTGTGESGKTTIIKQMKILHVQGFSHEERIEKTREIRRNIFESIQDITKFMPLLNPAISLQDESNQVHIEIINRVDLDSLEDFPQEAFDSAQILWQDEGVRNSFLRSHEYPLIDCAEYFLNSISRVKDPSFIPSDQDILHSRKMTTDIQKIDFTLKVASRYGGGSQSFSMFDVGGQRGERRKWIQVFDGISAVLFLVASSEFNCVLREDNQTNRLRESLSLFEEVWSSRFLRDSGFILFLNKQDLLKKKIDEGVRVGDYFPEYDNYTPHKVDKDEDPKEEYIRARCFIRDKFIAITRKNFDRRQRRSISSRGSSVKGIEYEDSFFGESMRGRDCFVHFTTATDTDNIKRVFDDVHTMIIINNLKLISVV